MTQKAIPNHEFFMSRCIRLAKLAKQRGENPVGSLVVLNGRIIGEGIEANKSNNDITYHAEIIAIRMAIQCLSSEDLSTCVLYSTHEPCIMCAYVIRHCKLSTVVFGLKTGNKGGYSSKYALLLANDIKEWGNPPELVTGILEEESKKLIKKK